MLIYKRGQPVEAIDFRENAPALLNRDNYESVIVDDKGLGPRAVGVPGTVAGLELARKRHATLPRRQLMAPAIHLAKNGHRIGTREGFTIAWNWKHLRKTSSTRKIFGKNGKARRAGTRLRRQDLAKTLERIADLGGPGFYRGPTARALVRGLGPTGLLRASDLAAYRAQVRVPWRVSYHGLWVHVMPPPSGGGAVVALVLDQLNRRKIWLNKLSPSEDAHLFLEASRRAQAVRWFDLSSPTADTPSFKELKRQVEKHAIDPARATPSATIHPLARKTLDESPETTHFSVVDAQGNAVSCTVTLSAGFGSKIMPEGTGTLLNNAAASFSLRGRNQVKPGARTLSSMAPTLVTRGDELKMVLGSPGGNTIPSTVVQVLRNMTDHGMPLDQAVKAPRLHHRFLPDEVRYERRRPVDRNLRSKLSSLGHEWSKKTIPIGDANNIIVIDGVAFAYADPREGGLAKAARKPTTTSPRPTPTSLASATVSSPFH